MSKQYDVVIVGAGPGGIFTALELIEKNPKLKIAIIEKGKALDNRTHEKQDLLCGWAGAGAWSDGKLILGNFDTNYGGIIQNYIDIQSFNEYTKKVDDTYIKFSDEKNIPIFGEDTENINKLKINCAKHGVTLLSSRVRHIGTDRNSNIMTNMFIYLKDKIDIFFETEVRDFEKVEDIFHVYVRPEVNKENMKKWDLISTTEFDIESKYLVMCPGRSGNKWQETIFNNHSLKITCTQIDIGVRVECPSWISKELCDVLYDMKLIIRTKKSDLKVRTFCVNPNGYVVRESFKDNGNEVIGCNGHSNSEHGEHSLNTNFALLVSAEFTNPFNAPNQYGMSVAKMCNLLAGDNGLIVQRLKDLKNERRSTPKRMKELNMIPTLLDATPGDISYALPSKHVNALLETFESLDSIMPGINGDDVICYAPEIKFYSARPELSNNLETSIDNLYCGGDAAVSRGIMQAGMSGIVIAKEILKKIK